MSPAGLREHSCLPLIPKEKRVLEEIPACHPRISYELVVHTTIFLVVDVDVCILLSPENLLELRTTTMTSAFEEIFRDAFESVSDSTSILMRDEEPS